MPSNIFIAFVLFLVIYLGLEKTYFSFSIAHHKKHFAKIQGIDPENIEFKLFSYGILAYAILVTTMWFLIFENGHMLKHGTYKDIILKSTMYGLAVYATYNVTNMAVFSDYRIDMMIVDSLWGIFVVNASAILVFFLYRHFWINAWLLCWTQFYFGCDKIWRQAP